jgi:hypothetical protein
MVEQRDFTSDDRAFCQRSPGGRRGARVGGRFTERRPAASGTQAGIGTRMHLTTFRPEEPQEGWVCSSHRPMRPPIENIYDSADMERRICKPLGLLRSASHP